MEWLLDIVLVALLTLTLFHALRLERALGVLQRDRAALEELVASFNSSTRQAEQGVEKLRHAADGAGRQIARHVEAAIGLKDDLVFLVERGERLADRLDGLVRAARPLLPDPPRAERRLPDALPEWPQERPPARTSEQASERVSERSPERQADRPPDHPADRPEAQPRLRSQAERDLLRALRTAR
jgi:hypothetical protein